MGAGVRASEAGSCTTRLPRASVVPARLTRRRELLDVGARGVFGARRARNGVERAELFPDGGGFEVFVGGGQRSFGDCHSVGAELCKLGASCRRVNSR